MSTDGSVPNGPGPGADGKPAPDAVPTIPADTAQPSGEGEMSPPPMPSIKGPEDDGELRVGGGEKKVDFEAQLAEDEVDLYGWCCVPVYNPHVATTDSYWDLIILVALFYVAICTPFEISFLTDDGNLALWFVNRILDLIFISDMCLSFNTCYKEKDTGIVVFNRWLIALSYLRGYFIIDFISLVPIVGVVMTALNVGGGATSFLQILRIVRLLRLTKLVQLVRKSKTFSYIESRYAINYSLVQLYLFLFGLFYLAHFLACGFHLVLFLEDNKECVIFTSWVESQECCYNWWTCFGPVNNFNTVGNPESPIRKYFIALEWAMGEMLTVGSDIAAVTDAERTYELAVHVIAGLVYAYLIGTVVAIFDAMTASHKEFFTKMDHLNVALAVHGVNEDNPDLCARLRTFYRFRNTFFEIDACLQEVFDNVTPHLRSRLTQQVYEKQIMRLELFNGCGMSEEMIADLSVRMTALPFGPEERLLHLDAKADHFFFLQMGIVLSRARVHTEGTVVGSDAIFAPREGCERGYDAITMTHGIVNRLFVNDLVKVMTSTRYKHSSCTKKVHARMVVGRCDWILREVTRAFKKAAKIKNYSPAVMKCVEELEEICKTTKHLSGEKFFKTCDHLFFEFWCKNHEDQRRPMTALRNSVKMKNAVVYFLKQQKLNAERKDLERALKPYGLLSLVERIHTVEKLDVGALLTLSALELHAVGFPMGTARKFILSQFDDVTPKLALSKSNSLYSPLVSGSPARWEEKPPKKGLFRRSGK